MEASEYLDPGLDPVDEAAGAYVPPDLEVDAEDIAQRVFEAIVERAPGWEANDGNLEVWLIEAFADVASEVRSLAADVPASIFRTYGEEVLGVTSQLPLPAQGTSTWTMQDDLGYTIETGWQVALWHTGDEQVAFEVLTEVEVPAGQTVAVDVPLVAIDTGVSGNGLTGEAEVLEPIDWVTSVTVDAPTVGGSEGQTDDEYLDLLAQLMRVVGLRPILPADFSVLALRVAGVGRAIAMDTYNAPTSTWNVERTITLVITDPLGEPVPASVKQEVDTYLQDHRELNFVVHVIDASYQAVAVSFEVFCFQGFDPLVVHESCVASLTAFLSPANWRLGVQSPSTEGGEVILPPLAGGQAGPHRVVRIFELVSLLDRVYGVDYVTSVKINGTAADHTLPDAKTLPRPGAITGKVTTPMGSTAIT